MTSGNYGAAPEELRETLWAEGLDIGECRSEGRVEVVAVERLEEPVAQHAVLEPAAQLGERQVDPQCR